MKIFEHLKHMKRFEFLVENPNPYIKYLKIAKNLKM